MGETNATRQPPTPQAKCRTCGALVFWARMPSGALNPIDPEPRDDGTVVLRVRPDGEILGHVLKAGEEPSAGQARRVSHFVTCPQAAEHRQRALNLGRP